MFGGWICFRGVGVSLDMLRDVAVDFFSDVGVG